MVVVLVLLVIAIVVTLIVVALVLARADAVGGLSVAAAVLGRHCSQACPAVTVSGNQDATADGGWPSSAVWPSVRRGAGRRVKSGLQTPANQHGNGAGMAGKEDGRSNYEGRWKEHD